MPNIPIRVNNLIKKHGTATPHIIANNMKIYIVQGEMPQGILGLWTKVLRNKYIGINETIKEKWQREAVIAHELAHILFHPNYDSFCASLESSYYQRNCYEIEANVFASHLLSNCCVKNKNITLDFLNNGFPNKISLLFVLLFVYEEFFV